MWRLHSLAPTLHDAAVLLGSQGVAGRLGQRLDLTGQIVAEEGEKAHPGVNDVERQIKMIQKPLTLKKKKHEFFFVLASC